MFGVWPAHATDVYAISVDEKFPEYFGLFHKSFANPNDAESGWAGLAKFESSRNESQGASLVEDGWTQLVPQLS